MHMENGGEIVSCDVHGGKLSQIKKTAQRLGIDIISVMENNGAEFHPQFQESFDAVITDVPCSGLGVIRKKPDIRYKPVADMEALPGLQRSILEQAGKYVVPGGYLLYSTCTILKRENEDVVHGFLADHGEFTPVQLTLPEGLDEQETGMLTLYQGINHCDGFYMCLMRKKG